MKLNYTRLVSRGIAKTHKYCKSRKLRLLLLNTATRILFDRKNRIDYDKENDLFWLKWQGQFLLPVENPVFQFKKASLFENKRNIYNYQYSPKEGDTVLDIGAGNGSETWYFMEFIGKKGNLFNIEASTDSFRKLELITKKNKFSNCFNFNLAIANSSGYVWMEEKDNYIINQINMQARGNKVESIVLDDFVSMNNIDKIDFLKVNIEGSELEMIEGFSSSVHLIENFAISCHDFLNPGSGELIRNKLENFFIKHGFVISSKNTGNPILDSWLYGRKRSDA